ncbi:CGNR zinc finger domain-containing protein [Legionella pneumophila]|uniref:CGNR zinc finger domain-containing protein n=1 Tax=Legionella pneumophila TaxID=446 RepID=UPI003A4C5ECF
MEKTLHDYFYINTGNEIKFYSDEDSSFLIEAANFYIERKKGKDSRHTIPELDAIIYECMDEYYKNGITDNLLNKLNEILRDVKIQCLIENIENKLSAVHVAYIPNNPSPIIFGAYMFSHITSFGGLDGLKRCHNKDCLKFFIGRSNTKWCSNSCGSRYRVNKMRKNKKASCSELFL